MLTNTKTILVYALLILFLLLSLSPISKYDSYPYGSLILPEATSLNTSNNSLAGDKRYPLLTSLQPANKHGLSSTFLHSPKLSSLNTSSFSLPTNFSFPLTATEQYPLGEVKTDNLTITSSIYDGYLLEKTSIEKNMTFIQNSELSIWFQEGIVWGINTSLYPDSSYQINFNNYGGFWRSGEPSFPIKASSLNFTLAFTPVRIPTNAPLYFEFDFANTQQIYFVFYNQSIPSLFNDTSIGLYFLMKNISTYAPIVLSVDLNQLITELNLVYSPLIETSFYMNSLGSIILHDFSYRFKTSNLAPFITRSYTQLTTDTYYFVSSNGMLSLIIPNNFLLSTNVTAEIIKTYTPSLFLYLQNNTLQYTTYPNIISLNVTQGNSLSIYINSTLSFTLFLNSTKFSYNTNSPLTFQVPENGTLNIYYSIPSTYLESSQVITHETSTIHLPYSSIDSNYSQNAIIFQRSNILSFQLLSLENSSVVLPSNLFSNFNKGNLTLYLIPFSLAIPFIAVRLSLITFTTYLQIPDSLILQRWITQLFPVYYFDMNGTNLNPVSLLDLTINEVPLQVNKTFQELSISNLSFPPGYYNLNISFSLKGYQNQSCIIPLKLINPELSLVINPIKDDTIYGFVKLSEIPHAGISVQIYGAQHPLVSTITNQTGYFSLPLPSFHENLSLVATYLDLQVSYNLTNFVPSIQTVSSFMLFEESEVNTTATLTIEITYPQNGSLWKLYMPNYYSFTSINASVRIFNITTTHDYTIIQYYANRTKNETDLFHVNLGMISAYVSKLITPQKYTFNIRFHSITTLYNVSITLHVPPSLKISDYSIQTNMTIPILTFHKESLILTNIHVNPHLPNLLILSLLQKAQDLTTSSDVSFTRSPFPSLLLATSGFITGLSPTIIRKIKLYLMKKNSEFILQL